MPGDITVLITASQKGDDEAIEKLYRVMAPTLRKIAAVHLQKEKPNHTLGIDGVVNDAFLELVNLNRMTINDRNHFCALANNFIERRLNRYWRWKTRPKRGGDMERLPLDEELLGGIPFVPELEEQREATERLAIAHPNQHKALVLYYFDGYSQPEIAKLMDCSLSTVQKSIRFAKTWLTRELNG